MKLVLIANWSGPLTETPLVAFSSELWGGRSGQPRALTTLPPAQHDRQQTHSRGDEDSSGGLGHFFSRLNRRQTRQTQSHWNRTFRR